MVCKSLLVVSQVADNLFIFITVLAVGYSNGTVCLRHIENADVLHEVDIQEKVTSMNWVSQEFPEGELWSPGIYPEDNSVHYLPKLEPLNKR